MRSFVIASVIGAALAACPNGCSGNGICGANDKCSCYQNWQGPDCSLRTCTYALAWADTADGTNQAHYYAECSNKGACDRKTGECKCFDGYEGKGCRRSTCPEGCSGHGTCEYIDELAVDFEDRRTGPGYNKMTTTETTLSNAVTQQDNSAKINGYLYQLWDAQKIQGCKCDLGYTGPDCASRVAPKGDDPLTTVKSKTTSQHIQIKTTATIADTYAAATISGNNCRDGAVPTSNSVCGTYPAGAATFFLVYYDQYGGVWRTDAIDVAADDAVTAANVQEALRELPNEVLEGATATARSGSVTTCLRPTDGAQHIPSAEGHGTANACATQGSGYTADAKHVDVKITFNDKPGQTGTQFLFEIVADPQVDGSYPVSRGIHTLEATGSLNVAEEFTSSLTGTSGDGDQISELAECSDRGLDNGDGECECFEGFRGLACEEQEALV